MVADRDFSRTREATRDLLRTICVDGEGATPLMLMDRLGASGHDRYVVLDAVDHLVLVGEVIAAAPLSGLDLDTEIRSLSMIVGRTTPDDISRQLARSPMRVDASTFAWRLAAGKPGDLDALWRRDIPHDMADRLDHSTPTGSQVPWNALLEEEVLELRASFDEDDLLLRSSVVVINQLHRRSRGDIWSEPPCAAHGSSGS